MKTLRDLDVKIDFERRKQSQVPTAYEDNDNDETAYVVARPESVNLWLRHLAHCRPGIQMKAMINCLRARRA